MLATMSRPFSLHLLRVGSLTAVLAAGASLGCGTLQSAAAQDPMKCERDPKCGSHMEKSRDCVTVCVDDPACIDRCREVTGQPR
jgi:hypothetical protein